MITRKQAVRLINSHLDIGIPAEQKAAFHYGRMELMVLLDLIYGGPPDPLAIDEHLLAK
jgi:hypothetical protein